MCDELGRPRLAVLMAATIYPTEEDRCRRIIHVRTRQATRTSSGVLRAGENSRQYRDKEEQVLFRLAIARTWAKQGDQLDIRKASS